MVAFSIPLLLRLTHEHERLCDTAALIVYWLVDLNSDFGRFLRFTLALIGVNLTATSFGMCISAMTPNIEVAGLIAPITLILMMLFGGFYINVESIPDWLIWLESISFIKYAYQALLVNEFDGGTYSCEEAFNCLDTGDKVLDSLSMDDVHYWEEFGKLMALAVGFRIIGYFALRYFSRPKIKLA
eukprot:m.12819 g.12819  ORF g.12819 m.12819 type:complete len:185 (+) comp3261_c0_seq2:1468-2022(+)